VLDDLDKTLAALLERELPAPLAGQLALSFLAPGADFPPSSVTPPALSLFLYDLRQDRTTRTGDWEVERDGDGAPTGRRPPPARVECGYLITAWPSSTSTDPARDDHRLLGEVLRILLRHPRLPADVLQGVLAGTDLPLPALAVEPGRLQQVSDVWQATGGRPKLAIACTVTIAVDVVAPAEAGPPVREPVVTVDLRAPTG
jgi:hypothetical protein